LPDESFRVRRPCPGCPFARACAPGGLGGSPVEVYIGQLLGGFWLPCHSNPDYNQQTDATVSQCAGAAIFRANLGIDAILPPMLHRLPEDQAAVFGTVEQFVAHHTGWPCPPIPNCWLVRMIEDEYRRAAASGLKVIQ